MSNQQPQQPPPNQTNQPEIVVAAFLRAHIASGSTYPKPNLFNGKHSTNAPYQDLLSELGLLKKDNRPIFLSLLTNNGVSDVKNVLTFPQGFQEQIERIASEFLREQASSASSSGAVVCSHGHVCSFNTSCTSGGSATAVSLKKPASFPKSASVKSSAAVGGSVMTYRDFQEKQRQDKKKPLTVVICTFSDGGKCKRPDCSNAHPMNKEKDFHVSAKTTLHGKTLLIGTVCIGYQERKCDDAKCTMVHLSPEEFNKFKEIAYAKFAPKHASSAASSSSLPKQSPKSKLIIPSQVFSRTSSSLQTMTSAELSADFDLGFFLNPNRMREPVEPAVEVFDTDTDTDTDNEQGN